MEAHRFEGEPNGAKAIHIAGTSYPQAILTSASSPFKAAPVELSRYQVKHLAALTNTSKRSLERRYASEFDCPPKRWLDRQRIIKSLNLLMDGNSIKTVASDLRYCNQAHFTRRFLKVAGITPGAFLKLGANQRVAFVQNFVAFVQRNCDDSTKT